MKNFIFTLLFVIICVSTYSQVYFPQNAPIYVDSVVPRIDISIAQSALDSLYDSDFFYSDVEYHADFVFNNQVDVNQTIENIGIRLRGNTSRVSAKKSLKISFNTFVSGRKFFGFEKLNLNGEHNDPSIIRSKLYWDILRQSSLTGPRANHVDVYINGTYYGLYISVEHIDENFVESRYGNNSGNLYKCLWPANLAYLGNDPNLYKLESNGARVYELKTNETADDYSDLAQFINVLNNTTLSELPQNLEPIFNVNSFLKVLAVDVLTANWDGYAYNNNNFYLYHNAATGKFEYIPYDTDNTFGIDWFSINWATRNIYTWYNTNETRPLAKRLLEVTVYKQRFSFYINQILATFNTTTLYTRIDKIKTMISPSVQMDLYSTYEYGWNFTDFNNSYTQALGTPVKFGLKPYISERITSSLQQLQLTNIQPIITNCVNNKPHLNQNIILNTFVEDEDVTPFVSVHYRINNAEWVVAQMFDDGQNKDRAANDNIFGVELQALTNESVIDYYFEANDAQNNTTREPIVSNYQINIFQPISETLAINEFMASNSTTIVDEYGDYEDWIEIYNYGTASIYLGDKFLSDNLSAPNKWQLPNQTLQAGEYLIIWADDDPTQGALHTNYKLSAGGEEIGIFAYQSNSYVAIDTVVFGAQTTDISMGRLPNGQGDFQFFTTATPGGANTATSISNFDDNMQLISIFPNPCSDYFTIKSNSEIKAIEIFSLTGNLIYSKNYSDFQNNYSVLTSNLQSGIYFVKINYVENKKIKYKSVKIVVNK